jgi:hypothetical protein
MTVTWLLILLVDVILFVNVILFALAVGLILSGEDQAPERPSSARG